MPVPARPHDESGLPERPPRRPIAPEPSPGAPSRALRLRAARGWLTFMRRVEAETSNDRRQEAEA